jgi:hypothetical protein
MQHKTDAFLADIVLYFHFGIVVFIVGGFVLIITGFFWNWRWIRNWRFRLSHFAAISFVALQSLCGQMCSLTTLESELREAAGQTGYERSFVATWVSRILYWDFSDRFFTILYVMLALLALALLILSRPKRIKQKHES